MRSVYTRHAQGIFNNFHAKFQDFAFLSAEHSSLFPVGGTEVPVFIDNHWGNQRY